MISDDEVKKIAKLAHLSVGDADVPVMAKELSSIIDYINHLNSVDVTNIEPMSHVHGVTNVYREDKVEPHLPVEDLMKMAPDHNGRFIRVPIIIE